MRREGGCEWELSPDEVLELTEHLPPTALLGRQPSAPCYRGQRGPMDTVGLGFEVRLSGSRAAGILSPASYSLSAQGGGEET